MPTTCHLQYSNSYPDQFQDKGVVDKGGAMKEFELFPWKKQADDYEAQDDRDKDYDADNEGISTTLNAPTVPKIIFKSDENQLIIATYGGKEFTMEEANFNIEYANLFSKKYSAFTIIHHTNPLKKDDW